MPQYGCFVQQHFHARTCTIQRGLPRPDSWNELSTYAPTIGTFNMYDSGHHISSEQRTYRNAVSLGAISDVKALCPMDKCVRLPSVHTHACGTKGQRLNRRLRDLSWAGPWGDTDGRCVWAQPRRARHGTFTTRMQTSRLRVQRHNQLRLARQYCNTAILPHRTPCPMLSCVDTHILKRGGGMRWLQCRRRDEYTLKGVGRRSQGSW